MVRPTIILTRKDVAEQIDIKQVVPAIERCMAEFERGEDFLPPKYIFSVPNAGGISACMGGYTKSADVITMKLGQERKGNVARGLPSIIGAMAMFDRQTGELLMIVESVLATMYRTASSAAVGAKLLARKDAKTLAVIGAGALGRQCVRAVSTVRPFTRVLLHDARPEFAAKVAVELSHELKIKVEPSDAKTACSSADVIATATNSTTPIVMSEWVRPGTHLSCMGADLHEKIECEMMLIPRCRVFADNVAQCLERGEVSQAVEKGLVGKDVYAGSLGAALNGTIPGRQSDQQITMFDGIGIGVQDTTIAKAIYDQALAKNLGMRVQFE